MSPVDRTPTRGRTRKSPLRLAADPVPVVASGPAWPFPAEGLRAGLSPQQMRQMMISEYGEWLRTQTSRHGRPFQEETIPAYRDAAVALSTCMSSVGLEADFTEYGHAHPYTGALVRYAPVKTRPSTLAAEFIKDLLEVTVELALHARHPSTGSAAGVPAVSLERPPEATVPGPAPRP